MLDENDQHGEATSQDGPAPEQPVTTVTTTRRRAAGRPAGPPAAVFAPPVAETEDEAPIVPPKAKKRPAKKKPVAAPVVDPVDDAAVDAGTPSTEDADAAVDEAVEDEADDTAEPVVTPAPPVFAGAVFQAPPVELAPARPKRVVADDDSDEVNESEDSADGDGGEGDSESSRRRRRGRGGRRRRRPEGESNDEDSTGDAAERPEDSGESDEAAAGESDGSEGGQSSSSRRRRRRARAGEGADTSADDPENTVVKVREGRSAEDEITGVSGSTRLEAKKQRRREGREAGRRRAPIVTEAEFLARRESVNREMVVRQRDDYTQIAVLEDKVLVEHYVARESQTSLIGNVYLGKVQNVLPSMEAAFVDIGAGRNAVIYAGEVDWSSIANGKQRKIEDALQPGQTILVQVTKDPIGQKGARLTSQISIPGRFLVYVPGGGSNGISRKLPENERARLKALLKEALPENVGVIVRTAAEGATEDQLTRDITALTARWEDIERKVSAGKAPELLYAEPDLMIKVIRDLFNEDFAKLIVEGDEAWDMVSGYISHVAPDLAERLSRWEGDTDAFTSFRLDEQIHKALDRKVHLPSGGSLVIDRTEAMTVVDVNTGRFTGSGGNLEETVTKNNLEAAEEIVRQLRLRDLGGIIVIDFIDMVLESNRDLVLRRLVECLGRDRTRHQVAEVTSLGLVQMTRKRIGTGLLESFSHECEHCHGRGVVISDIPVEPRRDDGPRRGRRGGRGGNQGGAGANQNAQGTGGGNQRGRRRPQGGADASSETPPTDATPGQAPLDDAAVSVDDQSPDREVDTAVAEVSEVSEAVETPEVSEPSSQPESVVEVVEVPTGSDDEPAAEQPHDEAPDSDQAPVESVESAPADELPAGGDGPVLTDEGSNP